MAGLIGFTLPDEVTFFVEDDNSKLKMHDIVFSLVYTKCTDEICPYEQYSVLDENGETVIICNRYKEDSFWIAYQKQDIVANDGDIEGARSSKCPFSAIAKVIANIY